MIIVTGGCGFIGGRFVEYALDRDTVINIDCLTYAADAARNLHRRNYEHYKIDITNENAVMSIVGNTRYGNASMIVHFAAETHVDNSLAGPSTVVRTNVIGTLNMLALAKRLGCRFVHVSTDEVTGDAVNGPTNEDSAIKASSPYSASKAAAELLVKAYVRSYGLDAVIVRPVNCYGPYQHPEKFIPRAITYALSGRKIPLFTPGTQRREWLHVDDCVRGIWAAYERGRKGEVYCLPAANGRRFSNAEVAGDIAEALGAEIELVADRPGHDVVYATESKKARNELGWTASISDWLTCTIEWYKANQPWWQAMIKQGGKW